MNVRMLPKRPACQPGQGVQHAAGAKIYRVKVSSMNTTSEVLEKLNEILEYESETGLFTWKVSRKGCTKGKFVGSVNPRGYVFIHVLGKYFQAHRLAWLMVHGEWPKQQIDHINRIKTDNRIANLREASHTLNQQNRVKALRNNSLVVIGVSRHNSGFQARIGVNGMVKSIGVFKSIEEASAAYKEAKNHLHKNAVLE